MLPRNLDKQFYFNIAGRVGVGESERCISVGIQSLRSIDEGTRAVVSLQVSVILIIQSDSNGSASYISWAYNERIHMGVVGGSWVVIVIKFVGLAGSRSGNRESKSKHEYQEDHRK